jgi:zinc D-Ala-D-Ala carboxypeptidase
MSNTLQGAIPNTKFKKDYKILGRKNKHPVNFRSKILFGIAILMLMLGFSSIVFANSYNNFAGVNGNLPENQSPKSFIDSIANISSKVESQSSLKSASSITISSSNLSISSSISSVNLLNSQSQVINTLQSSQSQKQEEQKPLEQKTEIINSIQIVESPKITLRLLSGGDFQQIYESTQYQNVSDSINPTVTDVPEVDNYIKSLAEKRGYKLRPQALEHYLVSTDGFLLQQPAHDSWINLKQAAASQGINLVLTSGYRSIASQKSIFAADLAPEYQVADILSGKVDGPLNKVMDRASVPGYSRHHTGYTIDIGCGGEGTAFKNTSCYQWMKKDNFAQARLSGYIPSYPEGANLQGPNPEEWEFVWVGDSR